MTRKSLLIVFLTLLVACADPPDDPDDPDDPNDPNDPNDPDTPVVYSATIYFTSDYVASTAGEMIETGYVLRREFDSLQEARTWEGDMFTFTRNGVAYSEEIGGLVCFDEPDLVAETDTWSVTWSEGEGFFVDARGTCVTTTGQSDWSI